MPCPAEEFPKGMYPPEPEAPVQRPAPLTLADGNYVAAIRQVLGILPVEVRVDWLQVVEEAGRHPEVQLRLTILAEKEGLHGQDHPPVEPRDPEPPGG